MASILEEFAYGNISPQEQFAKKDSMFDEAVECVSHSEQKLLDSLCAADNT